MPRDKATSKMDEARFWAMDEDMCRSKAMTAVWTQGVITCARSEAIGVIGMKGMACDQLEACRLKIT